MLKLRLLCLAFLVLMIPAQLAQASETTPTPEPAVVRSQEDTPTTPAYEVVTISLSPSDRGTSSKGQTEWTFQVQGLPSGTGSVPLVLSFKKAGRIVTTGTSLGDGTAQQFVCHTGADTLLSGDANFNLLVDRDGDPVLVLVSAEVAVPDDGIPWEPQEPSKKVATGPVSGEPELPLTGGEPTVLWAGILAGACGLGLRGRVKTMNDR